MQFSLHPQTKFVTFHRPEFTNFIMNGYTANESPCFEYLLGLNFNPDPKWNTYIRSVGKYAGKIIGSFTRNDLNYLPSVNFARDRSDNKRAVLSYPSWGCPIRNFQPWYSTKTFTQPFGEWYLHPTDTTFEAFCYSITISTAAALTTSIL